MTERTVFDVGVLGSGSAGEALVSALRESGLDVVVFEPSLVGGECPFVACIPSKAMLHDAAVGTKWLDAVDRRDEVVNGLDDSGHAQDLADSGATLVRSRGRIVDEHHIEADGTRYEVAHVVIATGAGPVTPPIDGLDTLGDRCWTSSEALTSRERPTRLTIIGGGVIGCELATLYRRFGSEVHLLDSAPRAFEDLPAEIGAIIDDSLRSCGVRVHRNVSISSVERRGGGVLTTLDNGATLDTDRVIVAVGKQPRLHDLGLDTIGLDADQPLPVDSTGRVQCAGSVWAIGDVAGKGAYTHLANHQAAVVANQLGGDQTRRFDDVVVPACMFTDPPMLTVGPNRAELSDRSDVDVMWVSARLDEVARAITDELGDGYLTIAVDVDTRCLLAAHGVGHRFDELTAALVCAIDGCVPVDRLVQSMFPFPTVSELLKLLYERAIAALDGD